MKTRKNSIIIEVTFILILAFIFSVDSLYARGGSKKNPFEREQKKIIKLEKKLEKETDREERADIEKDINDIKKEVAEDYADIKEDLDEDLKDVQEKIDKYEKKGRDPDRYLKEKKNIEAKLKQLDKWLNAKEKKKKKKEDKKDK